MNPTYAEIKLNNLVHNYKSIRSKTKRKIMAVVKADSYGHGMIECVRKLSSLSEKPEYYGVALESEAIELADSKIIKEPILCFGPFQNKYISLYQRKKIIPTITSVSQINDILKSNFKGNIKVHINVNTGMNRLGIRHDELLKNLIKLVNSPKVIIDGIYTHFATSDERNKDFANLQLSRFISILEEIRNRNMDYGIAHAANSGAILDMPQSYLDMVRPGISLYGYYPSLETSESIKLKPVMSVHSKLSTIFPLLKGDSVGYGRLFSANKKMNCGSAPIGYADGLSRGLSNKIKVIIGDRMYQQIGRISMDRININLENNKTRQNSKVIILGSSKNHRIDAWDWCKILNTIPYEITCNISRRVPRIYR